MVSIDFRTAFDRISHDYLRKVLAAHAFSDSVINRIMNLYDKASSEILINGFKSRRILIRRPVKQGCPLSMILIALCLNLLIQQIDKNISGIKMGRRQSRTAIIAYVDDVTIFLTRVEDIYKLELILRRYEKATGARINVIKSRAMAFGNWDTSNLIWDIPYHTDITILGYQFTNSVNSAAVKNCIDRMQAVAQETYNGYLNIVTRIQFVHDYLLAKVWYMTQNFPPTPDFIRRINTTITWFIWKGEIFRVLLSTLQRGKQEGGWNLYDADI